MAVKIGPKEAALREAREARMSRVITVSAKNKRGVKVRIGIGEPPRLKKTKRKR